jgi:ABC-type Mn2+/Zn2+ transport system ATPase subunit
MVDWDFPVSVMDVALMGRYGHAGLIRRPSRTDREIALAALERVRMAGERTRLIGELSGGQRRRVLIARALAQDAGLILLDEPFAGLDATSQHDLIALFKELSQEGKTLFVATHDLSCVSDDFDHAVLLNKHVVAFGRPEDVFTEMNLNTAFQRHLMVLPGGARTFVGS